jgi:hypothetical protein
MTTITQERAGLANIGRSLRLRSQWGSRFDYSDARSVTEPARAQFIHITVTNPSSYSSDDAHIRAIESIGISRFPSTGISYNRLHTQSGTAFEGQPIGRRGAHTVNDLGLGSCVRSGCPSRGAGFPSGNLNYTVRSYSIAQNIEHAVTDAELDSLAKSLAADILAGFVVRGAPIHGHRCVSSKSCPADRMWSRMIELEQKRNHYVAVGFGAIPEEWDMATGDEILNWLKATFASSGSEGQRYAALQNGIWTIEEALRVQQAALLAAQEAEDVTDDAQIAALQASIAALQASAAEAKAAAASHHVAETGRYADLKNTITQWAEGKDVIRHDELLAILDELIGAPPVTGGEEPPKV